MYYYSKIESPSAPRLPAGCDIPTTKLIFDPNNLSCTTSDQIQVGVDLICEFRIVDPVKATTVVHGNLFASIETMLLTTLYEAIRSLPLAQLEPRAVQAAVQRELGDDFGEYGVKMGRVLVEKISIPKQIETATIQSER